MAPLLTADLPWLLYRSFFGLPRSIKGADSKPVGALLGTLNTLLAVIDWCQPRAVACCFGAEDAAHRVAAFPGYHAHRDPMPAELRHQWELAPALLEAFGWTVAADERLEADDLLWSFARTESHAGGKTLILTADRDLYQAVNESVAVVELNRDGPPVAIGPEEVFRRSGVSPEQIVELIALRGDPSDGIPGARGVGAKTAAALLAEYATLDGVLAATYRLRPRIGAALREQEDDLRIYREIAQLVDIPVDLPADRPTDLAGGAAAADQLGMTRLAARLRSPT
jgi:DNA polymerase-1